MPAGSSVPSVERMFSTQPRLSRRDLLRVGIGVAGATALSSCVDLGGGGAMRLTAADNFGTPLTVPPLAEGEMVDGVRVFELTARAGTHDLGGATASPTWGFNGSYLGPTLRARVGENVRVRFTNELDERTTVHWHGMHLPAAMDGGPHQMVNPGETWEPEWTIDQQPTTLWYHPHPHGETERHVYNGLAGMFLLDPPDGPHAFLPSDYGVDDFPLVIQDKRLNGDGTLDLDDNGLEIGFLGDRVVANGTWGGHVKVTTELVRLRLLNGSTARVYNLGFRDDRTFDVIGTDGGLLAAPWQTSRVQLSPGERADVVVRMRPREHVRLASFGAVLGDVVIPRSFGAEDDCDVLELRAADRLSRSAAVPTALTTIERLDDSGANTVREFVLEGREINGRTRWRHGGVGGAQP
jgi:FtsP/CotA-like multicopper oxidase with cupredoxin domain